eukprot:5568173-Ditylum_brightwellii.AAC.1
MLDNPTIGANVDGCIVCTPHAKHFQIREELLQEGKKRGKLMNILMEKPMTTNIHQAHSLHNLATTLSNPKGCFLVNHSANFQTQARTAREVVLSGKTGKIRHVAGFMASPLSWIFDDPSN